MDKKIILFAIVGIILLGGLFWAVKPENINENLPAGENSGDKIFELSVKGRKLVSGDGVLKAEEGDVVVIKITVDEAEELHLHGYDKSIDLIKDVPGEMSLVANITGRFEFELEKSKTHLGVLEVLPK